MKVYTFNSIDEVINFITNDVKDKAYFKQTTENNKDDVPFTGAPKEDKTSDANDTICKLQDELEQAKTIASTNWDKYYKARKEIRLLKHTISIYEKKIESYKEDLARKREVIEGYKAIKAIINKSV